MAQRSTIKVMGKMSTQGMQSDGRRRDSARPDFVFILADDLGYADLACYGGREDCSPNLDQMASEDLLFTDGYANSSVCSSSRFAIATGRYQYRLRGDCILAWDESPDSKWHGQS
jgi:arylsulfatase A-like enzyme